jgi:hypothetical protein
MAGLPQIREAAWFVTGPEHDPVRHLFLRLEERRDGSGTWTVELFECRGDRGNAGMAMRVYPDEAQARTAVLAIYTLAHHLERLPTWEPDRCEVGRWRVLTYACGS